MILLKLELTNFLSYRDTPALRADAASVVEVAVLNFNGIHLACISGANGAGNCS